jgi:hypothetical protein
VLWEPPPGLPTEAINKGKGEMEGEGARVKPDDTWNLVNYVRSFSKLQAATAAHGPS